MSFSKVEANMSTAQVSLWRNLFPRYRIVHRLPGRLRIKVPLLEKVPVKWHPYAGLVTDLACIKQGILNVHIQPISGSILITYEPAQINENQIKEWIRMLVESFLNLSRNTHRLSREEFVSLVNLIKTQLQSRARC